GYWGKNWVRVLNQLNVLGAACDADADRLKAVARQHELDESRVRLLQSYDEMVRMDLDGIFVVTPPASHADLAVAALKAGKHVFVEKPLAGCLEDCYRMKFEAEHGKRIVMSGHTFIYHPAVRKFKESLALVGKLRTIYTIRANFGLYQKAGLVDDLLPHDLSIFNYLCDSFSEQVRADVNPHQDVAFVTALYGDVVCNAFLSWAYPEKTRKLAAVGDRGILEWDISWRHLLLHRKWAEPAEGRYTHHDEGTQSIEVADQSEPLMNEALHFMECIRQNKPPLTGIDDGISVVKGLEACR
ncbi:MAG TPA: Gfo/Idh/MocA family oxidoreductase, partial [Phycisphaerae bacterium]|nr:Gfo/Idh/MocA family oxidoreductase [Phycisphaerae bacterium]